MDQDLTLCVFDVDIPELGIKPGDRVSVPSAHIKKMQIRREVVVLDPGPEKPGQVVVPISQVRYMITI